MPDAPVHRTLAPRSPTCGLAPALPAGRRGRRRIVPCGANMPEPHRHKLARHQEPDPRPRAARGRDRRRHRAGDKVFIAVGSTEINAYDRVVVFAMPASVARIGTFFN